MKKSLAFLGAALLSLSVLAASSTPKGFTDDLDAALASAKKSGKTVFAVFSGSDWCYWCKVIDHGYFSKKEFVSEASKKLELVFIDTPQDKSVLSENAKKKNPGLVEKYGIRGFPTVMFIMQNGKGVPASRPGRGMSPEDYAKRLAEEAKSVKTK